MTPKAHWQKVWHTVQEVVGQFPEDSVLIGGVAVFLHTQAAKRPQIPVEFTHVADMYIGQNAWADLRDTYEVVPNRRLSKHQITVQGVEVDLYIEHQNGLRVVYRDLALAAVVLGGVRVACLEHLLLLKLSAFSDRRTSSHGQKDQRDIAKILILLSDTPPHYLLAQVEPTDMVLLDGVLGSSAFLEIADGNAHTAAPLRKSARIFVARLKQGLG